MAGGWKFLPEKAVDGKSVFPSTAPAKGDEAPAIPPR